MATGRGDGEPDDGRPPAALPPPTLAGGVELVAVDPPRLLAGEGLAYGQPLPSQQAAADAYLEDPEVAAVVARPRLQPCRRPPPRRRARCSTLNGAEIFDETVLDAFVSGAVGALGDGTTEVVTIADRPVLRSTGPDGIVLGYREGNQLMLVRGANDKDVATIVERQLQALRRRGGGRRRTVHAAGGAARSSRCSCRCRR